MKNSTYKNFVIHHFEKLDSTNSYALELIEGGQVFDREIIIADSQDNGRGRLKRSWSSPQGNLYFSLILQPQASKAVIYQLSFVAIVALRSAVAALAPHLKIKNKWPNDLIINDKKVAGLLLESSKQDFVVVGIGVNLVSHPQNTLFAASDLNEMGINIDKISLLKRFLDEFEGIYQNWLSFGFSNIRRLWLENGYKIGQNVKARVDNQDIAGIFEGLDEEGVMILRNEEGAHKVSVGDVS